MSWLGSGISEGNSTYSFYRWCGLHSLLSLRSTFGLAILLHLINAFSELFYIFVNPVSKYFNAFMIYFCCYISFFSDSYISTTGS